MRRNNNLFGVGGMAVNEAVSAWIEKASIDAGPAKEDSQLRKLVSTIKRGDDTSEETFKQIMAVYCFTALVESHRYDHNYQSTAKFAEKNNLSISLAKTIAELRGTDVSKKQLKPLVDSLRRLKAQNLELADKLDSLKYKVVEDSKLLVETSERLRARSR